MFCSKCGKQVRDGMNYCTNCGEPVKKDEGGVNLKKYDDKVSSAATLPGLWQFVYLNRHKKSPATRI